MIKLLQCIIAKLCALIILGEDILEASEVQNCEIKELPYCVDGVLMTALVSLNTKDLSVVLAVDAITGKPIEGFELGSCAEAEDALCPECVKAEGEGKKETDTEETKEG